MGVIRQLSDRQRLRSCLFIATVIVRAATTHAEERHASGSETHPLMPGIRSAGVRDPNWSRPWHDKLATGFSPLVCGMKTAPAVWTTIPIMPQAGSTRVVTSEGHDDQLLVSDDRLRLVTADGKELWSRDPTGETVLLR